MKREEHKVASFEVGGVLPKINGSGVPRKFIILIVLLIALPIGLLLVRQAVQYRSSAAVDPASITVLPSTANMPPNTEFSVMVDVGTNDLGFAQIEMQFDNTLLQLTQDPYVTIQEACGAPNDPANLRLCTTIESTTMVEANSTGRIVFVLGLTPADKTAGLAPTGVFEFARLSMSSLGASLVMSTNLPLSEKHQLVDINGEEMVVSIAPSTITFGSISTPTPTLPFATGVLTPTLTPTPTSVPALNPVSWTTSNVILTADDFYIQVPDGRKFYSTNSNFSVVSDLGSSTYTTLEAIWDENGEEMRLFMYFNSNSGPTLPIVNRWWSYELRTYGFTAGSGTNPWVYYTTGSPYFTTPAGQTFTGNVDLISDVGTSGGSVHFENLNLTVNFNNNNIPTPTPTICSGGVPGDADGDCDVDLIDYSILFSVFGLDENMNGWLPWGPAADFVADGTINLLDYGVLFLNFGTKP